MFDIPGVPETYDSTNRSYVRNYDPTSRPRPPLEGDLRFTGIRSFRDISFAVLFFIHLVGVGIILYFSLVVEEEEGVSEGQNPYIFNSGLSTREVYTILIIVGFILVATIFFSILYLVIMIKFPTSIIIYTLVFSVCYSFGLAVFGLAYGEPFFALFFFLFGLLQAMLYFMWRPRIPFASALLSTVSQVISMHPGTIATAFFFLFIHIIFIGFWGIAILFSQRLRNIPLEIFLIFSLYWTSQVIKNTVHVTNAGVVATWYFMGDQGTEVPQNPTTSSLKRALTTSFGSICLGSLLIALLQTLRAIVSSLSRSKDDNFVIAFLAACASFILWCFDALLQYFNIYAFTQVAIYGKTYIDAARSTWRLIQSQGLWAVINDNIISGVLFVGMLGGGLISGTVGGVLAFFFLRQFWIAMTVLSFIIGFLVLSTIMELVESGVASLFVCFAEDPLALRRNNPNLYNLFYTTYSQYLYIF